MNKKFIFTLAVILTSVGIAIASYNKAHVASPSTNLTAVKPAFLIKKQNAVRLYPNPTSNGTIKVSSEEADELHFYVFDMECVMIAQKVLKDKKLHTISNLKKGVYLYDVFKKDMSIEQGSIVVK